VNIRAQTGMSNKKQFKIIFKRGGKQVQSVTAKNRRSTHIKFESKLILIPSHKEAKIRVT